MKDIENKLNILKNNLEKEAKKVIATNCKVFRLFVRRDGFKDSDTLIFKELTNEQFYILTKREWNIPISKRINLSCDEALPPYCDTNKITLYPKKWKWNKKTLEILYEEI